MYEEPYHQLLVGPGEAIASASCAQLRRDPNDFTTPSDLSHPKEAGSTGYWPVHPDIMIINPIADKTPMSTFCDPVCHIPETELSFSYTPYLPQVSHLLKANELTTPSPYRTRQPETARARVLADPSPLNSHSTRNSSPSISCTPSLSREYRWFTVVVIHQSVPTKAQPSQVASVLVTCLASPSECRPEDLCQRCTLSRRQPRFSLDPRCRSDGLA